MASDRNYAVEFLEQMLTDGYKTPPEDKMISYKDVLYPSVLCSAEILQTLETFEFRKDDVVLAGYPKSGTNWVEKMLYNLRSLSEKDIQEEVKKKRIEMEKELVLPPRIEFVEPDKLKRMAQLPSRRIIVTHLPPHLLSKSMFKNKAKILLLIRNPKDLLVSYFHFCNDTPMFPNASWDQFFTNFMNGKVGWGSYFDCIKEWDKYVDEENVMPISYEELKENPVLGLKNIAKFFGFSVTEDEIQTAAEKHSFKAMKKEGLETHGAFANMIFRKGAVGDWKSLFTEHQSQEMDRKFKECLAGTKLGIKLKYEVYCKM